MKTNSPEAGPDRVRIDAMHEAAIRHLRSAIERHGDAETYALAPGVLVGKVEHLIDVESFAEPRARNRHLSGLLCLRRLASPICQRWAEVQRRKGAVS